MKLPSTISDRQLSSQLLDVVGAYVLALIQEEVGQRHDWKAIGLEPTIQHSYGDNYSLKLKFVRAMSPEELCSITCQVDLLNGWEDAPTIQANGDYWIIGDRHDPSAVVFLDNAFHIWVRRKV